MEREGGVEEAGCLGVGKVCERTRGDWAAVSIEVAEDYPPKRRLQKV